MPDLSEFAVCTRAGKYLVMGWQSRVKDAGSDEDNHSGQMQLLPRHRLRPKGQINLPSVYLCVLLCQQFLSLSGAALTRFTGPVFSLPTR